MYIFIFITMRTHTCVCVCGGVKAEFMHAEIHSRLLLFALVILYKLTANPELPNTEPSFLVPS